jgi:hypothetical protein
MSIQERLQNATALFKTKLPSSVAKVVYKGQRFDGLVKSKGVTGEKLPFAESEQDLSHLNFDVADCESDPKYGDLITVDDEDRLVKDARKDPFKVTWMVDHVEYYSDWAYIYDDQTNPDNSTVYERVKVRVMDGTESDYTQFPDGDFTQDMFIVALRRDAWPLDALPKVGYVLDFDERDNLYVSTIIEQSGDIRLMCREAGG